MNAGINVNLHNRFDIEVRDAKTNELKQKATAYNIVLDAMWSRLVSTSAFMTYIHIGTGTGTLSPSRTSLFTFLVGRAITWEAKGSNINNMYRRVKIQLQPSEFVGSTITEVGVAYGTASTSLCTHAMLTDAEGNPISILKTDTDVIIIYATVYFTVAELPPYVKLTGIAWNGSIASNNLLSYLTNQSGSLETRIRLGTYGDATTSYLGSSLRGLEVASKTLDSTTDVANKRRLWPVRRFEIAEANGHIQEVSIGASFNIQLPNENYTGTNYTDVILTGNDGSLDSFLIPSANVSPETVVVKVNNVETDVEIVEVPYYKHYVPTSGSASFCFSEDILVQSDGKDVSWDGQQFTRTNNNSLAIGSDVDISLAKRSSNTLVFIAGKNIRFKNITTGAWRGWNSTDNPSSLHKVAEDVYIWGRTHMHFFNVNTYYTLDGGDTWGAIDSGPISGASANCASNTKRITMYGTSYNKFNIDTLAWQDLTITGVNSNHRSWAFTSDDSIMVSYGNSAGIRSYHEVSDLVWEADSVIESTGDTNIYTSGWFIDDEWLLMCTATVATLWHFDGATWVRLFLGVPRTTFMDLTSLPNGDSGRVSPLGHVVADGTLGLKSTGKFYIKFDTPPAELDEIKVSYKVNGIHKTSNYVLDVSGYIQFGEG